MENVRERYQNAKNRLLIFDYDGTLTPIMTRPEQAVMLPETKRIVQRLIDDGAHIVIVSGRPRDFLQAQFAGINGDFAAEHGSQIKRHGAWQASADNSEWTKQIEQIFSDWTERYAGSHYEVKQSAIAWHYRETTLDDATASQLLSEINELLSAHDLRVIHGKKVIEIIPKLINKGEATKLWLADAPDFVLAAGDDTTDEDMFAIVKEYGGDTIKIGEGETIAQHRVGSPEELVVFLESLTS